MRNTSDIFSPRGSRISLPVLSVRLSLRSRVRFKCVLVFRSMNESRKGTKGFREGKEEKSYTTPAVQLRQSTAGKPFRMAVFGCG